MLLMHFYFEPDEVNQLMCPGCLSNSIKQSTKRLCEHLIFSIFVFEFLASEDFLCDKNTRESCKSVKCVQSCLL